MSLKTELPEKIQIEIKGCKNCRFSKKPFGGRAKCILTEGNHANKENCRHEKISIETKDASGEIFIVEYVFNLEKK